MTQVSTLEQLNQRQQEAVQFGSGPLLIIAGAGTGKRRLNELRKFPSAGFTLGISAGQAGRRLERYPCGWMIL